MKDLEQDDSSSDARLEREIVQALAIEPSAEFVARVRVAVRNDQAAWGWHLLSWQWVAIGSAAVVMVVALGSLRAPRAERTQPPLREASTVAPDPPTPATVSIRPGGAPIQRRAASPAEKDPRLVRGPDVLMSKDESAALKRLMQGVRQSAVEFTTLDSATDGFEAVEPPTRIVVSPITAIPAISIEPLVFEEGRQQ